MKMTVSGFVLTLAKLARSFDDSCSYDVSPVNALRISLVSGRVTGAYKA